MMQVVTPTSWLYPWLTEPFQDLTKKKVPNSLLIYGEKDLGKLQFGLELAKYLLCEAKDLKPCGQCEACHWVTQGNHPDLFVVLPQNLKTLLPFDIEDQESEEGEEKKASKFIRIDQIRQVISQNELGSYRGGKRVILIYPIESMQQEAANCLLKTLEEPHVNLHFILMTHQIDRILPTIRSRCSLFPIGKPKREIALDWLSQNVPASIGFDQILPRLALCAGSPLRVLQTIENKSLDEQLLVSELVKLSSLNTNTIIEFLNHHALADILNCMLKWSMDINLISFGLEAKYFPHYQSTIEKDVRFMNRIQFQQFLSTLKEALKMANHPLFPKVQLDALLNRYKSLF
jgi:DNA polymerase-3 subunit delta'